jgi:hypothetical protein
MGERDCAALGTRHWDRTLRVPAGWDVEPVSGFQNRRRRAISRCPGQNYAAARPSEFFVPLHQMIIDQDVKGECECGRHQKGDQKELNEVHRLYSGSRRAGYLNAA